MSSSQSSAPTVYWRAADGAVTRADYRATAWMLSQLGLLAPRIDARTFMAWGAGLVFRYHRVGYLLPAYAMDAEAFTRMVYAKSQKEGGA